MKIDELYGQMIIEMNEAEGEMVKFGGGNKSAGTRVRKSMQNIKGLAQSIRQEVQAIKNA
jgi:hypothetical protein